MQAGRARCHGYTQVDYLVTQGVLATQVVRKWNGRYTEIHTYLLSLNLLAFMLHTILDMVDDQYSTIRQSLRRRRVPISLPISLY